MQPFDAASERHLGEGPFAYIRLTRLWHRVRYLGCLTAIALGVALLAGGYTTQGVAIACGGCVALIDARRRIQNPEAALWPAFAIDATLIATGAPLAGLPPQSLLAAFAYLGTAALFFVESRRALGLLAFMAVGFFTSAQVASISELDRTQASTFGSIAGAVTWTAFLLGIVWIATRAVDSFHTEREASRERLQHLVRQKDVFVATVAHELRTPITAVIGLSQQLHDADELFDEEERQELIALVVAQAQETAHIVDDLLVASRIEDGQVDIHPVALFLSEQTQLVLDSLPGTDAIELVSSEQDVVVADPGRVRQIVRNLVTNALRYGAAPITVTTSAGRLTVGDHGPGIPVDDRDRIFEPYGRSNGQTHAESVGLGLALCRSLATLMGGDVSYERTDDRSLFHLTLPTRTGGDTSSSSTRPEALEQLAEGLTTS